MLAFGALTYEVEHGRLELDALRAQVDQEGGVGGGTENSLARLAQASERRAALAERLPYGTPDDGVAVGSRPLFDEYERKLREVGTRLDPHLREEDVPLLRRQMEAVCVIAAPPFADSAVPALTADPKDDPILYTALLADADLLISSDKHLVPNRKEELWERGRHGPGSDLRDPVGRSPRRGRLGRDRRLLVGAGLRPAPLSRCLVGCPGRHLRPRMGLMQRTAFHDPKMGREGEGLDPDEEVATRIKKPNVDFYRLDPVNYFLFRLATCSSRITVTR